jgi:23S rRNA (adenine2030-N6)-methyltransferase
MNYRHSFHAGNFADCLKHAVLLELLRVLLEKDSAITYIETHAGRGRYPLDADAAEKTGEWRNGIGKLMPVAALPPELHRYVQRVKSVNHERDFLVYPGSPLLAAARLRPLDTLHLAELHADEARLLQLEFAGDRRVRVYAQDGYSLLKALLPPTPKRGLVLIDPPFEASDEFAQIENALQASLQRWATGVYVIWYPIKNGRDLAPFYRALKAMPVKSALIAELCVHADESNLRLNGSGVAILNAPYQFDLALQRLLKPMHRLLKIDARARMGVQWLQQPL